jgi:hypothetical protein
MFRISLVTFLVTICLGSSAQTCDTLDGWPINYTDQKGLKQGLWQEYRKTHVFTAYSGLGGQEGCQPTEYYKYTPYAEGCYSNNRKTGAWRYFTGDNTERTVTYSANGSAEELNYADGSLLTYSKDSLSIHGHTFYKSDTIMIDCENKVCNFYLKPDKSILQFEFKDYDSFDYEFTRLKVGVHNRKIEHEKLKR